LGNAKSTLTLRCDPNCTLGTYLQFQGPGVQYGTQPVNGGSATVPSATPFTFDTTGNPTSSAITGSFAAGWGGGVVATSGVFYLRTATGNIPITYTGVTSSSFTGCTTPTGAGITINDNAFLNPIPNGPFAAGAENGILLPGMSVLLESDGTSWIPIGGVSSTGTFALNGRTIAIGHLAGASATNPWLSQFTAVGNGALQYLTTATGCAAFGENALQSVTTGNANTGVGVDAGYLITLAGGCTVMGSGAGKGITTGSNNTHFGTAAGVTATVLNAVSTAQSTVFVGSNAGPNSTTQHSYVTAVGDIATTDGSYAGAFGYNAGAHAAGAYAFGVDSSGTGAISSTANLIVIGTANHSTQIAGMPAFVTGDKYVVVNSAGVLHISSLGPVS
jgi:hypothetical protein